MLTIDVADTLTQFFRRADLSFRDDMTIRSIRLDYLNRDKTALSQLMSGLLHENPYLEAFELRTISAQTYLNVNNFLENFEDITIGQSL